MGMDFKRSGLKTGVENDTFILKYGKDLENQGAQPHQKIPRSTPFQGSGGGFKSCRVEYHVDITLGWMLHFGYYSRQVSNPIMHSPLNTAFLLCRMPLY